MTLDPIFGARSAGPPGMLAANTDRERAIDVLKAGFAEGRLTKGEYDDRTARVYAARTYGELGWLVADLPSGPFDGPVRHQEAVYRPRSPLNSAAVASLTCGIGVFLTMGLTAIPAIVLGHVARREVRRTGERGDGMALTGVALGWTGIALIAVALAGLVAIAVTAHSVHQGIVVHPVPYPVKPVGPVIVKPVGAAIVN